jgi:hypothetical protein
MAMAGGRALDPAAITATASDGASNCATSDAAAIMAMASGGALDPAVPIATMEVNSVAALAASSAVPTVAAACHDGTRASTKIHSARASHAGNGLPFASAGTTLPQDRHSGLIKTLKVAISVTTSP